MITKLSLANLSNTATDGRRKEFFSENHFDM
jgi:hypothetical protein